MLSRARWSSGTAALLSLALLLAGRPLFAQEPMVAPTCDPLPEMWARADYLLWHIQGSAIPALVTGSPPGTARANAGVLGAEGTVVYFGNQHINNEARSGFSVEAGWLGLGDEQYPIGVMANFFMLDSRGEGFKSTSDGSFTLARPFFNVSENDRPDARLVAFPGESRGTVEVRTRSELFGGEFNIMQQIHGGDEFRIAAYIGYRYLRFRDLVRIQDDSEIIDPLAVPGSRIGTSDSFDCTSLFHGCNFGLDLRYNYERLSVTLRTSLAVGYSSQYVRIAGATTILEPPGAQQVAVGGLLALPSNIGTRSRTDAAVVPQFGATVGYGVTDWARVLIGYDFLYLSNAATAGSHIDIFVNPTQFPPGTLVGASRPAFFSQPGEVWAQGLRLGLELAY